MFLFVESLPMLLIIQLSSAILVYSDSKKRKMTNALFWIIGVALFMPFFLPFYILLRPRKGIFHCPFCLAENQFPVDRCQNCGSDIELARVKFRQMEYGILDVITIIVLSFFVIPFSIAGLLNAFGIIDRNLSSWGDLVGFNFIGTTSLLILSIWFIFKVCKRPFEDIGLTKHRIYYNVIIGLVMLIPTFAITYFAEEAIVRILTNSLPSYANFIYEIQEQEHNVPASIYPDQISNIFQFVVAFFLMVILAPIAEEITFRGMMYSAFRKRHGKWFSMTFSALIFAFSHGQVLHFIPILFSGYILAYLFERTRSLVPSISLHILINLFFTVAWYYNPSLYT
ncbi:MAG: lysostaphin resistance A-like protein [Candidatus Poribacteria bacterium]